MEIQELVREFTYNGVKLADPNATFTLVQVRDFYATVYPEITSADIEGPKNVGAKAIYSFRRAVGTKGLSLLDLLTQLNEARTRLTARDREFVEFFLDMAKASEPPSTCQGMLLVELHRRYFPVASA